MRSVLVIFVLSYFVGFVLLMPPGPEDKLQKGVTIAVLTGGKDRIEAGLMLLEEGLGRQLFISGVHPSVTLKNILKKSKARDLGLKDKIILDYKSKTTRDNAIHISKFMENQLGNLLIITSDYHLPRTRLEVSRHMNPRISVRYKAVKTIDFFGSGGIENLEGLKMYFIEYNKLILTWVRYKLALRANSL